jgi:hypothetical protein
MVDGSDPPERPRVEPEIIPPDRARGEAAWRQSPWRPYASTQAGATHRIYITRIGPFRFALLMLVVAVLVAVILLAILGAVLLWIPVVLLLVFVAAVFRLLRR